MHHMVCFNTNPHPSHKWTFYYYRVPKTYICPGTDEQLDLIREEVARLVGDDGV